jgi:serine/threonine-protein kinase RsbW
MQGSLDQELELELPAEPGSVTAARHAAGDFAARAGAAREDVELAVSEAVGNCVVHAFPEGGEGTITLRAGIRESRVVITVKDDGSGLRPNIRGGGLGLGIPLIASLSEDYRLEGGPQGGAIVTMTFPAERAA